MMPTYPAVLQAGRIEWTGETPTEVQGEEPVRVHVTIVSRGRPTDEVERRARLAAALEALAASGVHEVFGDPVEWQREQR